MPRYTHDHVRTSHKEATTFLEAGYEVILVCENPPDDLTYLGMRACAARTPCKSRFGALLNTPLLILQALELRADVYVVTNPFSLPTGLVLALLRRRIIYVTHEDFARRAEILEYIPRPLRHLVGTVTVICERMISRVAVATIATQLDVSQRYGDSILIENAPLMRGPIVEQSQSQFAQLAPPSVPTLIYSGIITRDRGLFRMLDLVVKLNEHSPWRLKLVGQFYPRKEHELAQRHDGWRHVEYLGHVPHATSLAHIKNSHFGLGLLDDVGGYAQASMTKLYEYMQMETPFVVSDFPRWRESIRNVRAGIFTSLDDPVALAREIQAIFEDRPLYESMKIAGKTFIESEFNWETLSQPLRDIARRLAVVQGDSDRAS